MISVTYFTRKPIQGYHSIEELFNNIVKHLPIDIEPTWKIMRHESVGIWGRLMNIIVTRFQQGQINHITGDIHYVSYLLSRRKTILTIHDMEIIVRNSGFHRAIILFFWFTLPARRVRIITVISEFTRQELLKFLHIPAHRIRVIHNCIPGKIAYTPKKFHNKCPIILQVGTKHNKNLPNLIRALEGVTCKLYILGKINDEQEELLQMVGVVYECFSGLSYEEVVDLYCKADILTFVSLYEGFGLPILEAQSVGRPVITSDISSMPEVAGDGAILIDPHNVLSIRQGILSVITHPQLRTDLINKGLENVKRFQPEVIAEEYAKLYREVKSAKK